MLFSRLPVSTDSCSHYQVLCDVLAVRLAVQ